MKTLDTTDRWGLTVTALLGMPLPELPAIPGRVHKALDEVHEPEARPEPKPRRSPMAPGWRGPRP